MVAGQRFTSAFWPQQQSSHFALIARKAELCFIRLYLLTLRQNVQQARNVDELLNP